MTAIIEPLERMIEVDLVWTSAMGSRKMLESLLRCPHCEVSPDFPSALPGWQAAARHRARFQIVKPPDCPRCRGEILSLLAKKRLSAAPIPAAVELALTQPEAIHGSRVVVHESFRNQSGTELILLDGASVPGQIIIRTIAYGFWRGCSFLGELPPDS